MQSLHQLANTHWSANGKALGDVTAHLAEFVEALLILDAFGERGHDAGRRLDVDVRDEPELLERLWTNTRRFKAELQRLGFDTGRSDTPITPVILGDSETTIRFSGRLDLVVAHKTAPRPGKSVSHDEYRKVLDLLL